MKRLLALLLSIAIGISIFPLIDLSAFAATQYEYALFPMRYMRITQGINTGTHSKYYAIDLGGKDEGRDNVRAPFTGKIARIYDYGNAVWFQSKNKVRFADGSLDYMTMLLIHDNDISDLKVGDEFKQGEVFYREGNEGISSGYHVHIEIARGKTTGWYHASTTIFQGEEVKNWAIKNGIEPWKGLHIGQIIPGKDTIIKEDKGYDWVTLESHTVTFRHENGDVLATEYVYDGDDVTYTGDTPTKDFDANVHYTFAGWDKSLNNITSDTTITAQFAASPHSFTYSEFDGNNHRGVCACGYTTTECPSDHFTDAPATSHWMHASIDWAVAKGITAGATATTFNPNGNCTRGQIVTFLWRAAGCPEPKTTSNPFTDVDSDDYFYKAVLWAVETGVTAGSTKTTFNPKGACDRAQVVTFMYRAFGSPAITSANNPFQDVPADKYYHDAVLWAVENGITSGVSSNKFAPNNTCTRGQIVTFLYRGYAQ